MLRQIGQTGQKMTFLNNAAVICRLCVLNIKALMIENELFAAEERVNI